MSAGNKISSELTITSSVNMKYAVFRNKVVVHRNWLKTRPAFLELERIDCKNKGVNDMKRRPQNLKKTILI